MFFYLLERSVLVVRVELFFFFDLQSLDRYAIYQPFYFSFIHVIIAAYYVDQAFIIVCHFKRSVSQISSAITASANLFNMTEDVDFDPELYVIKLKEQMIAADDEYQKLTKELKGQFLINIFRIWLTDQWSSGY